MTDTAAPAFSFDSVQFAAREKAAEFWEGPVDPNIVRLVDHLIAHPAENALIPVKSVEVRRAWAAQIYKAASDKGKSATVRDKYDNPEDKDSLTHIRVTIGEKRGRKVGTKTEAPAKDETPAKPEPAKTEAPKTPAKATATAKR